MRRWLALTATLLMLSGACSRIDLGWRAAPWLLEREGAQWLGLDAEERKAFGRESKAWLQAHGAHLAPKLGLQGRSLARDLRMGHDQHVVDALFVQVPKLWDEALAPALPPLAQWLQRQPLQRAEALQKAFAERNAKDAKRYSDPARSVVERAKRLKGGMKDWIGPLSPAQEAGLEAWAKEAAFPSEAWMADRQRRQKALLDALRAGAAAPSLQAQLEAWWLHPEKDRDPAYQRELEAYRRRVQGASLRLLASLSLAQRERLAARVQALAEDFEAIGAKSAPK